VPRRGAARSGAALGGSPTPARKYGGCTGTGRGIIRLQGRRPIAFTPTSLRLLGPAHRGPSASEQPLVTGSWGEGIVMDEQLKYYEDKLAYETDSWDLKVALEAVGDIILIYARDPHGF